MAGFQECPVKMPGGDRPLIVSPARGISRPGENSPPRRGVVPLGPMAAAPVPTEACCPIPAVDWRPINQVRRARCTTHHLGVSLWSFQPSLGVPIFPGFSTLGDRSSLGCTPVQSYTGEAGAVRRGGTAPAPSAELSSGSLCVVVWKPLFSSSLLQLPGCCLAARPLMFCWLPPGAVGALAFCRAPQAPLARRACCRLRPRPPMPLPLPWGPTCVRGRGPWPPCTAPTGGRTSTSRPTLAPSASPSPGTAQVL